MKRRYFLLAFGVLVVLIAASLSPKPKTHDLPIPIFTPTPVPTHIIERSDFISTPTSFTQPTAPLESPTFTPSEPTPAFSPTPVYTVFVLVPPTITILPERTVPPAPTETAGATPTSPLPPPTSTPLAPTATSAPIIPPTETPTPIQLTEATLLRIIDGDTLEVSFDNRTERVHLIGIDSPETNGPPICFGEEATAHAQQLLPELNGKIWLEKDISEADKYNRLLRYVWLDSAQTRMFDEQLVADGYAQVSTYPPDVKYESRFLLAQRTAQASSLGLWGACPYFGAPLPTPTSAAIPTEPPSTSPPDSQGDLPYDPNGPDRDCSDFATHDEAQRFFIAAGGPDKDPHRLDADHDGIACESLP